MRYTASSFRRCSLVWVLHFIIIGPCMLGTARADMQQAIQGAWNSTVTIELKGDDESDLTMASGTVVSDDGLIVTVVGAGSEGAYQVLWEDGGSATARLLVDDQRSGLRLLKIDGSDKLSYLSVASEPAAIGQSVAIVSSADDRARVASRGIVAATSRRAGEFLASLIQTDARTGEMAAGAPLVDEQGRLLGIVAVVQSSGDYGHATFAIPARFVQELLEIRRGEDLVVVHRGYMGMSLCGDGSAVPEVTEVRPGSPAEKAGVHVGDRILSIDSQAVKTVADVQALIGTSRAGARVEIRVLRGENEVLLPVVLDRMTIAHRVTATSPPEIIVCEEMLPRVYVGDPKNWAVRPNVSLRFTQPLTAPEYDVTNWNWKPESVYTPPTFVQPYVPQVKVTYTQSETTLEDLQNQLNNLQTQMQVLQEQINKLKAESEKQREE